MSDEQDRILRMVEAGTITASEANELLAAMENSPQPVEASPAGDRPEFSRPWEVPLFGGLVVAAFGVMSMGRLYLSQGKRSAVARTGAWFTVLLGLVAVAVGLWSRSAPWLHLRVQERDGNNVNISLPLPLFLTEWVIRFSREYLDEDASEQMQNIAAFVGALRRGERTDPLTIEVDEGDGDRVLIYIG